MDTITDYDRSIHSNPDARAWAKFFIESYENGTWALSEDVMIGWFANAMMAMADHLKRQAAPAPVPGEPAPPADEALRTLVDEVIQLGVDLGSCTEDVESDHYAKHLDDLNAARDRLLAGLRPQPSGEPAPETDLAELERLAREATPGPWVAERSMRSECDVHWSVRTMHPLPAHPWSPRFIVWLNGCLREYLPPSQRPRFRYCEACKRGYWDSREVPIEVREDRETDADARFIAAANPSAVLRLLSALRASRSGGAK